MEFVAKTFRQTSRLLLFSILLLSYALGATIIRLLVRNPFYQRIRLSQLVRLHTRLALLTFGVTVETCGNFDFKNSNAFIVSNHLGYLDALVISSLVDCSFVTSIEMRNAFFIGWLTKLAGCLYVERRNKQNLINEVGMLTAALENKLNVCVFPEATSTNGESVLRFRRPLYSSAIESQKPVVPICLNYLSIDGRPVTAKNRDLLFWYGDMPFFSHLWNFWGIRNAYVRVVIASALMPVDDEQHHLAEQSQKIVSSIFRPIKNQDHLVNALS